MGKTWSRARLAASLRRSCSPLALCSALLRRGLLTAAFVLLPVQILPGQILAAGVAQADEGAAAEEKKPGKYKGFYLGGNLGLNMVPMTKAERSDGTDFEVKFDPGFSTDFAVGYAIGQFRGEMTLEYARNKIADIAFVDRNENLTTDASIETISSFANAYWEPRVSSGLAIQPFVGFGMGFTHLFTDSSQGSQFGLSDDSVNGIAFQGIAGASWALDDTWSLTGQYRYRYLPNIDLEHSRGGIDSGYDSHAFMLGARVNLGRLDFSSRSSAPAPVLAAATSSASRAPGRSRRSEPAESFDDAVSWGDDLPPPVDPAVTAAEEARRMAAQTGAGRGNVPDPWLPIGAAGSVAKLPEAYSGIAGSGGTAPAGGYYREELVGEAMMGADVSRLPRHASLETAYVRPDEARTPRQVPARDPRMAARYPVDPYVTGYGALTAQPDYGSATAQPDYGSATAQPNYGSATAQRDGSPYGTIPPWLAQESPNLSAMPPQIAALPSQAEAAVPAAGVRNMMAERAPRDSQHGTVSGSMTRQQAVEMVRRELSPMPEEVAASGPRAPAWSPEAARSQKRVSQFNRDFETMMDSLDPASRAAQAGMAGQAEGSMAYPGPIREYPPREHVTGEFPVAAVGESGDAPSWQGGDYAVQLASFRDRANSDEGWRTMRARYGALLNGLKPVVQSRGVSGKGTWYRLFAAGLGEKDAEELCSLIKHQGHWCAVARL